MMLLNLAFSLFECLNGLVIKCYLPFLSESQECYAYARWKALIDNIQHGKIYEIRFRAQFQRFFYILKARAARIRCYSNIHQFFKLKYSCSIGLIHFFGHFSMFLMNWLSKEINCCRFICSTLSFTMCSLTMLSFYRKKGWHS